MRFALFYHSLLSDWNNAPAHGLRGVASELLTLGHSVQIFEPTDGWSLHNLREQGGEGILKAFHATYPRLRSSFYEPQRIDLDAELADADVVVAHEWADSTFLHRLGEHRARAGAYKLLFHDAPHRLLQGGTAAPALTRSRVLSHYDGVLAASDGLRRLHETRGWCAKAWTWREAVDTRIFRPWPGHAVPSLDLVWMGNWGGPERASELDEFLIEPIRALGVRARFYGARYPKEALSTLRANGIDYGGWIPDFSIPAALAGGRFTVNVPWRMRGSGLPHTPAIRALQAMACGIPVVTAPWDECERMFMPEVDLLVAHDGTEVRHRLQALHHDREFARFIGANGYQTVVSRHTCAHRAQELLSICQDLGAGGHAHEDTPAPTAHAEHSSRLSRVPAAWN